LFCAISEICVSSLPSAAPSTTLRATAYSGQAKEAYLAGCLSYSVFCLPSVRSLCPLCALWQIRISCIVSALGGCFSFNAYYRHKRREKAKKSGGISNNNAKIPTYHDSFEVKRQKEKGKMKKAKVKSPKAKGQTRRPLLLWIEIAAAFGLAMTFY